MHEIRNKPYFGLIFKYLIYKKILFTHLYECYAFKKKIININQDCQNVKN